MLKQIKKLKKGSRIAILSPSWGGPYVFPEPYRIGLDFLKKHLDFNIVEYPTTTADSMQNYLSPELRALDLINAFQDKNIDGIICSIGGDDSIRLLKYLDDVELPPKFFMGYSDSTVLLNYLNLRGFITFHGPSVMAGFYEPGKIREEFKKHVINFLFQEGNYFEYKPYKKWTQYPLRIFDDIYTPRSYIKNGGWKLISPQNKISAEVSGEVIGGSLEAFDFLRGTTYWSEFSWGGKILFLEFSEERPSFEGIKWILRSYGVQGVFDKLNGILLGRFIHRNEDELISFYNAILDIVHIEFGRKDIPIIANVDFGHTYPQQIFPIGGEISFKVNNHKVEFIKIRNPFK